MLIAKDRKALVPICVSDAEFNDRDSPVLYAAKELRWYFERMTAAVFELKPYAGEKCILVEKDINEINDDRLHINAGADIIRLSGGMRGVVYAVYELLEQLGCRFFTATAECVPVITQLDIPDTDFTDAPVFEYREHLYTDAVQNLKYAVKCRFNGSSHKIPKKTGRLHGLRLVCAYL